MKYNKENSSAFSHAERHFYEKIYAVHTVEGERAMYLSVYTPAIVRMTYRMHPDEIPVSRMVTADPGYLSDVLVSIEETEKVLESAGCILHTCTLLLPNKKSYIF